MGNWISVSCYDCLDCEEDQPIIQRSSSYRTYSSYTPTIYVPDLVPMNTEYFAPVVRPRVLSATTASVSSTMEPPGFSFEYSLSNPLSDEIACCICFGDYHNGMVMQMLPCNHIIHRACIIKWYQKSQTCPMCRAKENISTS